MPIGPSELFGVLVVVLLLAGLYELDLIRRGVEKTRHIVIRDYTGKL